MKSLIALLRDPGPSFTPSTPIAFQLSGATANVEHVLLQNRSGKRYVALWLDLPSCNPLAAGPCADVAVPAQTVALAVKSAPAAAHLYTFNSGGQMSSQGLAFSNGSATFAVTDQISIVELDP